MPVLGAGGGRKDIHNKSPAPHSSKKTLKLLYYIVQIRKKYQAVLYNITIKDRGKKNGDVAGHTYHESSGGYMENLTFSKCFTDILDVVLLC